MIVPFLRFEGPFLGRYSCINPQLLVKILFYLHSYCVGGIFPLKQKPPHDLWAPSTHHIWEEEFPSPSHCYLACLRLPATSEGAWKKTGWFLPSSLTVAWWPSDSRQYFQFCFVFFMQNIPNYLLYLNHSCLPGQLQGPPLIYVSGCMVFGLCSSLCAIDKASHSHSAGAAISSWCHENIYKCKLPLYFPFCHSHYQMHQIHCEFENKKRKKEAKNQKSREK